MDDIARQAGVTKGTIYLYFESKEAVFKALVREAIGTTLGTVDRRRRQPSKARRAFCCAWC